MTTPLPGPVHEEVDTPTPPPSPPAEVREPLTSADALDDRRANAITAAGESRVIVVSGLAGSGKTTLLASIYERLHAGPVGVLHFAGSGSTHAFEEWCHDGRLASERDTPDTPRTPHISPGECRFLHLRLAISDNPGSLNGGSGLWRHRDLLFTDLPGEVFERVRDDSNAAVRMPVFKRADHFIQLLDGDLLRDTATRQGTVADAKSILRSCVAAGALTRRTIVHLVATKWDLVKSSGKEPAVAAFFNATADSIAQFLQDHVAEVRRHITAARSPVANPIEDWGVMNLINSCYSDSAQAADSPPAPPAAFTNEFDRFSIRTGIE